MGDLLFLEQRLGRLSKLFLAPPGADLLVLEPFWGEQLLGVGDFVSPRPVYFTGKPTVWH